MIRKATLLSTLLATLVTGCARNTNLPPIPYPNDARERHVVHRLFRVGALDFGTRSEGVPDVSLAAALPSMLLTELQGTSRFTVHDGGGIRVGGNLAAMTEDTAKEYVDAYLSGTITSLTATDVCFDVRLSNAVNHAVLFTRSACTKVSIEAGPPAPLKIHPERAALTLLAQDIARAIKPIGSARVIAADGHLVFIDKGQESDVMPGMVAYIVATGEAANQAELHRDVQTYAAIDTATVGGISLPVIVGEVYIASVESNYSVGYLYLGDYAMPRDTVYFK